MRLLPLRACVLGWGCGGLGWRAVSRGPLLGPQLPQPQSKPVGATSPEPRTPWWSSGWLAGATEARWGAQRVCAPRGG